MASLPLKICKDCCSAIPDSDAHDKCLKCLGIEHDMFTCPSCGVLESGPRAVRRSIIDAVKGHGAFLDNWRERVYPSLIQKTSSSGVAAVSSPKES